MQASCSRRSTAEETDQLRFTAIMTSNSQHCHSKKITGDMSTSRWEIVQHKEQ